MRGHFRRATALGATGAREQTGGLKVLLAALLAAGVVGCGDPGHEFQPLAGQPRVAGISFSVADKDKDKVADTALKLRGPAKDIASTATPGDTAYKIGPQDILYVSVFKVPELDRTVHVADNGTISLPLLGEVPAVGKTARDLERDLTSRLGRKYLQSPQVAVEIKEYNSRRVTVEGAVKTPGVHALKGGISLLQVVAMSGGLDPAASDLTVVVFRRIDGQRYAARFEIDPIRKGIADDPPILPGDVVVANSSALKSAWGDFLKSLPVASFALLML
jgi:polysaccharide biosynthesis/export protein